MKLRIINIWTRGITGFSCFAWMIFAPGCTDGRPFRLGSDSVSKADDTSTNALKSESSIYPTAFSTLPFWNDGLSEMSYYDAVDTLYSKPRQYIRIMLLNREWLNPVQRVKAENQNILVASGDGSERKSSVPVFKLNIIEEIPTENYNYRHMITVFLNRHTLIPEKLAASSQEWCGTTFKQLQWLPEGLRVRSFSYFEDEADREWNLPPSPVAYPREALFVLARAACASENDMDLLLLPSMRSNHASEPMPVPVHLKVGATRSSVRVPFGRFSAKTITITDENGDETARYQVEAEAPYRLLSHRTRDGLELSLRYVERRAYWDRTQTSRFYRQGAAP
ncbi:MAG: hypothetical protein ACE5EQ_02680 [Phycisphaerae bacterium]